MIASTRASRARPFAIPCSRTGSPTMSPTVMRGLSDEYGSWKTMCSSRRSGRICRRERCVTSVPFTRMFPPVGSVSRSTQFATVDLPLPDSPTRPRISPRPSVNETPSTACTTPRRPASTPPTGKCFTRPSTSSTGPPLALIRRRSRRGGSRRRGEPAAPPEAAGTPARHSSLTRGAAFGEHTRLRFGSAVTVPGPGIFLVPAFDRYRRICTGGGIAPSRPMV